jgi:ABC-type antimicrobial peptide transport system permease subunit
VPVYNVKTMAGRVAESLAQRRFVTWLLAAFAALAVALAGIGIYGVMSYLTSQGRRDIGVRVALGATAQHVLAMVMAQGLAIAGWGLTVGVAGALALTTWLQSLLFGVNAWDPLTYAGVAASLAAISLLGVYLPARRAAQIDPVSVLRGD